MTFNPRLTTFTTTQTNIKIQQNTDQGQRSKTTTGTQFNDPHTHPNGIKCSRLPLEGAQVL